MKYIISGIVLVIVILISLGFIFDWVRRDNTSIPDQGVEIVIDSPKANSVVTGNINISGRALGTWFFEASFPIRLEDQDGNVLTTSIATATSDWMTTDFVPFTSKLTFSLSTTTSYGKIIFKNDNPSGDPTRDKFFEVPVSFGK